MKQRKSGKQQNWCWRMRTYLEWYTEWTSVQQMGAESANDSSDFLTLPLLSATSSLSLRPPSLRCPCALSDHVQFFFPQHQQLVPSAWGSLAVVTLFSHQSGAKYFLSASSTCGSRNPPPPLFFFRTLRRSGAICWPCAVHEAKGTFPTTDYCHYSSPSGCTSRIWRHLSRPCPSYISIVPLVLPNCWLPTICTLSAHTSSVLHFMWVLVWLFCLGLLFHM